MGFIILAPFGVLTGIVAGIRGRNPIGWGIGGFLFGCLPLFALFG
ncbi:MAG: hypothetical protein R3F17_02665 [Planctomycetota bacterium]